VSTVWRKEAGFPWWRRPGSSTCFCIGHRCQSYNEFVIALIMTKFWLCRRISWKAWG